MLTPFDLDSDIRAYRAALRENSSDPLIVARLRRQKTFLYEKVLREIAVGSIDPKTLAKKILEIA